MENIYESAKDNDQPTGWENLADLPPKNRPEAY